MEIIVTDDIALKSWNIKCSAELFRLTDKNRSHLKPWLPWVPGVKTDADSRKFIQRSLKEMKSGNGLELGIWYQERLAGCIGLHAFSKDNSRADLGYWLDKDLQGRGIMTQSVKALVDYGFDTLSLNRVGILASTENTPSCLVAERLRFTKEGILRQYELVNGRFLDYQIYSMLTGER